MATQTTNYGFSKPADNEAADIAVINQNFDIADTAIKNADDKAAMALSTAQNIDIAGAEVTADPSQVPPGLVGTITQWLGRIANRITAITGKTNWYDAPADSLQGLSEGKVSHSLATAANDFLVASSAGAWVKKTLAEVKTILGLGSAAYTASTAYATAAQGAKADAALPASSYTANDVLTKLKTVDGSGSGLDADSVDSVHFSSMSGTFTPRKILNVVTRGYNGITSLAHQPFMDTSGNVYFWTDGSSGAWFWKMNAVIMGQAYQISGIWTADVSCSCRCYADGATYGWAQNSDDSIYRFTFSNGTHTLYYSGSSSIYLFKPAPSNGLVIGNTGTTPDTLTIYNSSYVSQYSSTAYYSIAWIYSHPARPRYLAICWADPGGTYYITKLDTNILTAPSTLFTYTSSSLEYPIYVSSEGSVYNMYGGTTLKKITNAGALAWTLTLPITHQYSETTIVEYNGSFYIFYTENVIEFNDSTGVIIQEYGLDYGVTQAYGAVPRTNDIAVLAYDSGYRQLLIDFGYMLKK